MCVCACACVTVPYAEPSFFAPKFKSAYFNDSHLAFKKAVRAFIDAEIMPLAEMLENTEKEAPVELWQKMGQFGLLASRIGPGTTHTHVSVSLTAWMFVMYSH